MGDVPGGTTGKRQARAFTSFIEAANFRSKCLVIKQAKGPSPRPRRRGNIIRMACLYYVRVGEIGIPEVSGLGAATVGSSRFVARPFCELGPASTDQVLGVIGRHFDGAVGADIDGPTREGIHGPDAGWGKQANPISFRVLGVLTALVSHAAEFQDALARERLLE